MEYHYTVLNDVIITIEHVKATSHMHLWTDENTLL